MSQTYSATETYSVADVELVMRRVTADLVMIANSSGAITESKARDYGHDIEQLAKRGYLEKVDVTLLSGVVEQQATTYIVNTDAAGFATSRPGGVMWPKVPDPYLRIILFYTGDYDAAAKVQMGSKLRIGWSPTKADTSHSALASSNGRDYVSNGYGMQRKDYS